MNSYIVDLARELRSDIASPKAVAALSAGATSGLGLLVSHVAFATLIFSGPLAPHASQGVGLVLFGGFASCLVIALAGGYRGTIAALSPALVVGMAVIASTMDARGDRLFVSVAAALILSAVLTGVFCLVIGRFRLANLVRFVPYSVAAGFVAGIGGAVCLAAMSLMDAELGWGAFPALLGSDTLWLWSPGVAYGIALYWSMKRWRNPLTLPLSVALFVGAYHAALAALDISSAEAREVGLLLTSTADGGLWPVLSPADLMRVEWSAIGMQIPNMLALFLISLLAVVMNIAGLEVAANQELDWDREFRAGGIASLAAGLGGGTVATIVVPASLRSKLFGAATRWTEIVAALVIASGLFLGDGALELVPSALVGGILVFAGLGMLDEGLIRGYRRLPKTEFGVIALIFVAINAFGLLEGVGVGMLATLVFFAVRLSRVDSIESRFTARERRSNRVRPIPDRAILREEGERAQAYHLRGYVFFGSVGPLADHLRKAVHGATRPDCLMLDFGAVSGVDYSAVNVLSRFVETANTAGVRLVLSALPRHLTREFERNLPPSVFAELLLEPNADSALERCEEIVIAAWRTDEERAEQRRATLLEHVGEDLERQLELQIRFEELVDELSGWLDPREYAAGETLSGPKSPHDGLELLVSGRASAFDAAGSRLYQCGPGDSARPAGAIAEKVTSVVAEEPCRTLVMTPAARRWLETHRPALVLKLYGYLLADQFPAEPGVSSD
ncbi:MAG: SulP family inorganic anion transporter [Proteobacteria bacterium]|nr:SulP family inorganic anion transporter [Pseudomonadota bacterium]